MLKTSSYHPFRSARARERYFTFYARKAARWPVSAHERLVETSYGQTFVRVSGAPGAPPLVLLPGGSANSLMWWPNIAAFAESFETYAVDNLYDFGRSVYTRKPQKPEDLLEWLNELFDALNLHAKITMAGLSLGGWMAGLYALHCPERVKKVALLAPANTILMVRPEFALRAVACLLPVRFFTRSFIYWLFSDLVSKDEAGQRLADEMVAEMFLSYRCFKPMPIQSPTVFTDDELQKMKVPALFLVGEHEKIYPPQEAVERIQRLAPNWETGIILSAGHDLTFAQPEIVNKKVIEFFLR